MSGGTSLLLFLDIIRFSNARAQDGGRIDADGAAGWWGIRRLKLRNRWILSVKKSNLMTSRFQGRLGYRARIERVMVRHGEGVAVEVKSPALGVRKYKSVESLA